MFYFFLNKHLKSAVSSFAHGTYPLLKKIKDWKGSVAQRQQSHLYRENTAGKDIAARCSSIGSLACALSDNWWRCT